MVVRVYVSGISGNKEVKKRQQRVTMILDSKNVKYTVIDITEPGKENEKEFMQENSKAKDSKYALPPQIFNDEEYCGDYDEFDMANELDELERFLQIPAAETSSLNETKVESVELKQDLSESQEEAVSTAVRDESGTINVGNESLANVVLNDPQSVLDEVLITTLPPKESHDILEDVNSVTNDPLEILSERASIDKTNKIVDEEHLDFSDEE